MSQECAIVLKGYLGPTNYALLVDAYRQDRRIGAVREMRDESLEALEQFVKRLQKIPRDVRASLCLRAAALLHTEVAMLASDERDFRAAGFHFGLARSLAELVEPGFRRDWFLTVALFHQGLIFMGVSEFGFREATRYFEEALREFAHDPELLLAAGALWEWSGSLRGGEKAHLKKAEKLYERALRADPSLTEAKLRYSNVLEKRGRFEEAAAPLEEILAEPADRDADPHIIYRAHMTLGNLLERQGRPKEAAAHYRAATELLPTWQVGYLALSHALHTAGARTASREALEEALARHSSDESVVGWWSYEIGLSDRVKPLLLSLRQEILP